MNLLRRSFLAGAVSLLALSADITAANAILFSGAQSSGGGGGGVTSLTLLNTTGTTQQIGQCTPMFGLAFKKGDMPSGQYPILKTSGGTIIPISLGVSPVTWSDGSIKTIPCIARLPVTIAGSASLTVNVFNGGSAPSASGRTLADFAAGSLDLNVSGTGATGGNLSGAWVSDLNQGVTAANADNYVYMDGAAGKVWRIRASFRQSSADHGQLEGYWFVAALNDNSSALGGVRYLCRIAQPWYNVTSPAPQARIFSALAVKNGATTLKDMVASLPSAATFTWSGSGSALNCTQNFQTGLACQLTTTGTLPAGLSPLTNYAVYNGSAQSAYSTTQINMGTNFTGVAGDQPNSFLITPTNAGSGTHTATLLPMVSQFGTLYTAEVDGRYSYIQGGGSLAADSTILVQPNMSYLCKTGLLPSYALSTYTGVASNVSMTYYPGTAGPVNRNVGLTGEREDIAIVNSWQTRFLFTNALIDERACRVTGLIGAHLPVCLRDFATKSIPVVNNGGSNGSSAGYSGMPTANPTFRWYGTNNYSGFTPASDTTTWTQGWGGTGGPIDFSHITDFAYVPYLITGEPQYMDLIWEWGNSALCAGYAGSGTAAVNGSQNTIGGIRIASINGTTYYGIFFGDDLIRISAWKIRALADTLIVPAVENASYRTYLNDIISDTVTGINAYIAMLVAGANSYVTTNGMWTECDTSAGPIDDMWAKGYYMSGVARLFGSGEISGAKSFSEYLVKWPAHISNAMGPWLVPYYEGLVRQGSADAALYITSDAGFGAWAWGMSWSSGTNRLTITSPPPNANALANGDSFLWNSFNPGSGPIDGPIPAGFSGNTPYYAVNVSGSTCQLSATPGGSPITFTDSGSNTAYGQPKPPLPSSGFITDGTFFSASGYLANITGISNSLNALGCTVDPTYLTSMNGIIAGLSGVTTAFNADPKYAIALAYQ